MTQHVAKELTAWANMRLMAYDNSCTNILNEITEGSTMKFLLKALTGSVPKRLGSLEGLSLSQKITRVDWFLDGLKKADLLPATFTVDSRYFARNSAEYSRIPAPPPIGPHPKEEGLEIELIGVFPVLWQLITHDVKSLWKLAPNFQRQIKKRSIISEPIKGGPFAIHKSTPFKPFYTDVMGRPLSIYSVKREMDAALFDPKQIMNLLVNAQIKLIPEGKRLEFDSFDDLTNSKILCALVNSFVPGTFTSEVLLNDRWTINLTAMTVAKLFGVESPVTSVEINEGDEMGSVGFLTYIFMSGFQYIQATEVVNRLNELQKKLRETEVIVAGQKKQRSRKEKGERSVLNKKAAKEKTIESEEEKSLKLIKEELDWLMNTYDIEQCQRWVKRVKDVHADTRILILNQMKQRFDIVTVPDTIGSISIRDLCEAFVIDLTLTRGNGFYSTNTKETLWNNRRVVVFDKSSGEFHDDFSGAECPKGSVREFLGVHPTDIVEMSSSSYPDYELFYESTSRNKILKSGDRFLYQVFPGTPKQSERVFRLATKTGDLETVQKLTQFYQSDGQFVNVADPETGNTPLHLASRHGHFEVALHLLENGAQVNCLNKGGCTPFFVAVEGLHKNICELLVEWGGNANIKNNISKLPLEVIRNPELKTILEKKIDEFGRLSERLRKRDGEYLEKFVDSILSGTSQMASLSSRSLDGCALLHWAAMLGLTSVTKKLLEHNVDPNLKNSKDQTSLHITRTLKVMKVLISKGGDVNRSDRDGNTPLHAVCQVTSKQSPLPELVSLLIHSGGDPSLLNNEGLTPMHYAVMNGRTDILEVMAANRTAGELVLKLLSEDKSGLPLKKQFLYLAVTNGHLDCAQWLLIRGGAVLKDNDIELTAFSILSEPSKHSELVSQLQFLLNCGLDPNALHNNRSLLHHAAELRDYPELTDILVTSGADVTVQDNSQRNPLFFACMHDNFHAARTLIEKGADPSSFDVHQKTAFDYIKDHEEWMYSGYFYQDTIARLKAYSLKHSRLLVRNLTQKLTGVPVESTKMSILD